MPAEPRRSRGFLRRAACFATVVLVLTGCTERELVLSGQRLEARAGLPDEAPSQSPRGATPIDLPPQVSLSDWTHRAANPAHAMPNSAFQAMPRLIWRASVGRGEDRRHRITADPVVAGGLVFTVDSRARVMAHTTSGVAVWSRDLTPSGESADAASGAGLATAQGRLYVTTGFGSLVALDLRTGAEIWRQDLDAIATGAPTVHDGIVYVAGRAALGWAVDASDGRVLWNVAGTPSASGVSTGSAPAVSAGYAVFPFSSRELVATYAGGGTQAWIAHVAGSRQGYAYAEFGDITGDPVIAGGKVYAGTSSGRTAAFDLSSGTELWSARDGALSAPAILGESVFVVSDLNELVRLDAANGARVWATELPYYVDARPRSRDRIYAHYGPVPAGGRLWVASADGVLRGFDPVSGRMLASLPLPGGAATNPVLANRTIFVVSRDGDLLAFR